MWRKENQIDDKAMLSIIDKAQYCTVALSDNDSPYLVMMNFGYADDSIYMHSAKDGRKIEIIKKNRKVSLLFHVDSKISPADAACNWGTSYKSVVAFGNACFVEDIDEKRKALDILMSHYSDKEH